MAVYMRPLENSSQHDATQCSCSQVSGGGAARPDDVTLLAGLREDA